MDLDQYKSKQIGHRNIRRKCKEKKFHGVEIFSQVYIDKILHEFLVIKKIKVCIRPSLTYKHTEVPCRIYVVSFM